MSDVNLFSITPSYTPNKTSQEEEYKKKIDTPEFKDTASAIGKKIKKMIDEGIEDITVFSTSPSSEMTKILEIFSKKENYESFYKFRFHSHYKNYSQTIGNLIEKEELGTFGALVYALKQQNFKIFCDIFIRTDERGETVISITVKNPHFTHYAILKSMKEEKKL